MTNSPTAFPEIDYRIIYKPHDRPLESFYLPTLAASVHYDRSAGYFRSSALAAAAAGIVRLIANGGRMRLLVGAELSLADVEAIRQGYDLRARLAEVMLGDFPDPSDPDLRKRLEALAWMVAQGTLEIKVVLPKDDNGLPIPAPIAQDYYHVKKGIFTDAAGNRVGFMGSVNESAQGWRGNFEEFQVSLSWEGARDSEAIANLQASFDALWDAGDPYWLALDLPDAVRERLLKYAPAHPPTLDALETEPTFDPLAESFVDFATAPSLHERIKFQFLRDAPYLLGADTLGAQTSAIVPWPHQSQVARAVVARFPDRVLLADEVGLGKTIEAGLALRQLVLSGRVRRALLLTPAAVLRQWQEEIYEKFALTIPRYEGGKILAVDGEILDAGVDDPWDRYDLLLASSHLAKRKERTPQLLAARPWDLLLVDEAHHARRKDFLQRTTVRPNTLLTLLQEMKSAGKFTSLMLLTATPMQVHPVEVWDLLALLGLGSRWGSDENNFLYFFDQLRQPFDEADWNFVLDMVADYLAKDSQIDPHFEQAMRQALGPVTAGAILNLVKNPNGHGAVLAGLPKQAQNFLFELARRHTPLQDFIFRNTRDLLRTYVARGLLGAQVPQRKPTIHRIRFSEEEATLYGRVTEYISDFYQRYEEERRGLGFIMTIYRRRLTSSFYAIAESLTKRQRWLMGQITAGDLFSAEDEEDLDELEMSEVEMPDPCELTETQRQNFQRELAYLDDFLHELRNLSQADSKLAYLKEQIDRIFRQRETVIVFTQYTDTMDYIREQLRLVYGSGVACYSGRGGETWNGIAWIPTPKEMVKNDFLNATIKILLCTESASEGLNLQTCGVLINYDMPWNPMRVEQRIGRIDRIGQKHAQVWIENFFYKDSIEDRIYQSLKGRIRWFETVVGDLQPILAAVNDITRRLAMLSLEEQEIALEQEMRKLRQQIDELRTQSLNIDAYLAPDDPDGNERSPVTLADLERLLTGESTLRHLFTPHPQIAGAYRFNQPGRTFDLTFAREVFDRYPDSLHFFTYGNPLFAEVLDLVPSPDEQPAHLTRLLYETIFPLRCWYANTGAGLEPVLTLPQLEAHLRQRGPAPSLAWLDEADQHFRTQVAAAVAQFQKCARRHREQETSTLQAKAQRLLQKAALVELCLGQQQGLFQTDGYPTRFDESAVTNLARHGSLWKWMLLISGKPLPLPNEDDPFFGKIQNSSRESLRGHWSQIGKEASTIVNRWQSLQKETG